MSCWDCCIARQRRQAPTESPDQTGGPQIPQAVVLHEPSTIRPNSLKNTEVAKDCHGKEEPSVVASPTAPFHTLPGMDMLIVEDSDSEDNQSRLTKRASAAVRAVKSKFVRHLSAESNVKRQSQTSIGNSEEEIARRAELRRLRHKRIQNELQGIEIPDDASNQSPRTLRHPHSSTSLHQACVGPRDTLEFTVPDNVNNTLESSSPKSSLKSKVSSGSVIRNRPNHQNLNDVPSSPENSATAEEHLWPIHNDDHALTSSVQSPQDFPDSGSAKAANSNSPTRIGQHTDPYLQADQMSWDDQSTLGVWLIAQGIQSSDNSGICMESIELEGHTTSGQEAPRRSTATEKVVHGPILRPSLSVASNHSFARSEHPEVATSPSTASQEIQQPPNVTSETVESEVQHDAINDFPIFARSLLWEPTEAFHPEAALKDAPDNTSSKYNSLRPSFQPSPSRSRLNLHSLSIRDIRSLDLSPFHWHANSSMPQDLGHSKGPPSSYATAEDHGSIHGAIDEAIPVPWRNSPGPADTSSASHSETPSFHEREAELQTIQGRFGDTLSHRKLPASLQSKFREEFSESGPSERPQPSFLSKIYTKHAMSTLKPPKYINFFGNRSAGSLGTTLEGNTRNSVEQKRYSSAAIRSPLDRRNEIESSCSDIPTDIEDTMTWWEKAVKFDSKGKSSSLFGDKQSTASHQDLSLIQRGDRRLPELSLLPELGTTKTVTQPAPGHVQLRRDTSPQVEGSYIGRNQYELMRKNSMPPRSWARYPSHMFDARNGPANLDDEVNAQDFAVHATASDGNLWRLPDKPLSREGEKDHTLPLLSERLGKAIKTSFSKLAPLVDLRRLTTDKATAVASSNPWPSEPRDLVTGGHQDESQRSPTSFDGPDESNQDMLANRHPIDCLERRNRVSDTSINHAGALSRREHALRCPHPDISVSRPTTPHVYEAAVRLPRQKMPRVVGLPLTMSDCPLYISKRDHGAVQNPIWTRSFTYTGPIHSQEDNAMELEKWQRTGRLHGRTALTD